MTVRELITALLDCPMNIRVYIDKGVGPLDPATVRVRSTPDGTWLILTAVPSG